MARKFDDYGDPSYRLGVGMMILNAENKILVAQRLDTKGPSWQMPQGGISLYEDTDQAMLRELEEEIGTRKVEILIKSKTWYKYDLPSGLAEHLWGGRYKGQRQIWYVLRFKGEDKDINVHTYHAEFRDWKWVNKDELISLVIPFKQKLYGQLIHDLWPYVLRAIK